MDITSIHTRYALLGLTSDEVLSLTLVSMARMPVSTLGEGLESLACLSLPSLLPFCINIVILD